jgi:hypothetical protein
LPAALISASKRPVWVNRWRIGRVADVHLQLAAAAADADDLVTLLQLVGDGLADGAAGADEDDLHGVTPDDCG